MLARNDRQKAAEILKSIARSGRDYAKEPVEYQSARIRLLEALQGENK
jgi:hypothetical protein